MNPEDATPEEELEIRIVALLLGELPEAEAAELQARIDADPALQAIRDRLAQTLGLVKEASQQSLEPAGAPVEAMKLSGERREKLLTAFKTVPLPIASARPNWKRFAPLGWAAAVVGTLGILGGMLLPALSRSKSRMMMAQGPSMGAAAEGEVVTLGQSRGEAKADGDLGFTTNAVAAYSRVVPAGRSSGNSDLSDLASQSYGFEVQESDKSREAGQMLANFGRAAGAEQSSPATVAFDVTRGASRPASAAQGGTSGGSLTWEFGSNRKQSGQGESAHSVDKLSALNGPVSGDAGIANGTTDFFSTLSAESASGPVTAADGTAPQTVSASIRGYYSDFTDPEPIGVLESNPASGIANLSDSNGDVPVLGEMPTLGRLFRQQSPASGSAQSGEPLVALQDSEIAKRKPAEEPAQNRWSVQTDLVAPAAFAPAQAASAYSGGRGGAGGGGFGGVARSAGEPAPTARRDVTREARSSEGPEGDSRALGFDWALGNDKAKAVVDRSEAAGEPLSAGAPITVGGVANLEDSIEVFTKRADKTVADESVRGLKAGLAGNEALNYSVATPAASSASEPAQEHWFSTGPESRGRRSNSELLQREKSETAGRTDLVAERESVSLRADGAANDDFGLNTREVPLDLAKARDPQPKLPAPARPSPGRTATLATGLPMSPALTPPDQNSLRQVRELQDADRLGGARVADGRIGELGLSQVELQRQQGLQEQSRQRLVAGLPYQREKLEEAKRTVDALKLRLEEEKIEVQQPMESIVTIHDKAFPDDSGNKGLFAKLGESISGKKDAFARISVDKDRVDVEGLSMERPPAAYDPFFLQTEFEKITSQDVLNRVADRLGLAEKIAKERGVNRYVARDLARKELKESLDVKLSKKTSLIEIHAKSADSVEAAEIANAVAEEYKDSRMRPRREAMAAGIEVLEQRLAEKEAELAQAQAAVTKLPALQERVVEDAPPAKPKAPAPVPQPEVLAAENAFSTFSLNVSDVSFKLATASLEQGQMPDAASIRSEEFINAFDYRDPAPTGGAPLAFAWDRARSPFEHNRDFLRLSVQTAAAGRSSSQPLNLVVLLDNSGSMERSDRVAIRREALRVLATQLRPQDRLSVVTFARTANLRADGVSGDQASVVFGQVEGVTPEGGTNLEEAMGLAYATAQRHFLASGVNRVVLLTDGAANLGNVDPEALKRSVESNRRQGVALDCFGVGWEGFNDDLLETLSRNGDGRYGFLNSPQEAANGFAQQLAGALQVAASDVKVQVEFNPKRVTTYRQIGYAKHQLTKEQFRDNTVDAAEIGAAEAGNALYTMEVNPQGEGPLATVRVRYKVPGTQDYRETAWEVPFTGVAPVLEQAPPAMRLATAAAEFAEWLSDSPFAAEVSPTALRRVLIGVPEFFGANNRAKQLADAVATAGRLTGK